MHQDAAIPNKPTSAAPFFSYLMEKDERNCQQYHFTNGEYIFREGIRDDRVYLIQSGTVEVGYTSCKGQWVDMGPYGMIDMEEEKQALEPGWLEKTVLGEGDCLGELCCLHNARHDLSARALGDVLMLSVQGRLLKSLCANNTDLVQCITTVLAQAKNKLKNTH